MDKKTVEKEMVEGVEKAKALAEKEMKKVQKVLDEANKKTQDYIKKNPAKAAAISAGIGAAVGAALAMLIRRKK